MALALLIPAALAEEPEALPVSGEQQTAAPENDPAQDAQADGQADPAPAEETPTQPDAQQPDPSDTPAEPTAEAPAADDGESADPVQSVLGVTPEEAEQADSSKPYLVLGADLNDDQRNTVLTLLGVADPANYQQDYNVYYTTNAEEHTYFGDYLPASVIGTKAYSSILLIPGEKGSGISITTQNINYCTVTMYQNALLTAGVSDVKLVVAGPTPISGTAALVSTMKAYEIMTGKPLDAATVDAANNELVVTGSVGEILGDQDQAAELIAALKAALLNKDNITREDIEDALDQICKEMDITLDAATRDQIIALIEKLKDLDIDVDALKQQAGDLYDRISGLVDGLNKGGFFSSVGQFFSGLISKIAGFFQGLFS